ncbi:MAG TPA: hypothetical protein VM580_07865 [Labilithrix sp.]|jgi:hypothetical protein|nr:hypothetical protein [Labilithrix sp.]
MRSTKIQLVISLSAAVFTAACGGAESESTGEPEQPVSVLSAISRCAEHGYTTTYQLAVGGEERRLELSRLDDHRTVFAKSAAGLPIALALKTADERIDVVGSNGEIISSGRGQSILRPGIEPATDAITLNILDRRTIAALPAPQGACAEQFDARDYLFMSQAANAVSQSADTAERIGTQASALAVICRGKAIWHRIMCEGMFCDAILLAEIGRCRDAGD